MTAGGLKLFHEGQPIIFFNPGSVLFPQIEFIGEICSAGTGVKSEFFHCMFEEMTKAEYGMFVYPEEGSYMWFPVRVSVSLIFLQVFRTGKLCHILNMRTRLKNVKFGPGWCGLVGRAFSSWSGHLPSLWV